MAYDTEKRVVVTGMGVVSPIGNSRSEFWENLLVGKNGVRKLQHTDVGDYYANFGGEIDMSEELIGHFKSRKMARRLDRYIIYHCTAGREAIIDSQLDIEAAPERYGTILGSGSGGVKSYFDLSKDIITKGIEMGYPLGVINSIPSTGPGYFAQEHNLQGPCFSVSSACASSNHAIGLGVMHIKYNMAEAMYVGGTEAALNMLGIPAFGNIYALSRRSDDPTTASRPFDKGRDGFVIGEGCGVLCLESLEHAKKRGAKIYCEVSGFGFSCDAHDIVAPHPDGLGSARAIRLALESAQLEPRDIDLINTHATSTPLGDAAEYQSVREVFGEYADRVPVQNTKSMTGHLLGGAGGIESVALIMAFERGLAHHTINQFNQDPEIGFNIIRDKPREMHPTHILSNGFGFSGQNATLIFSRFK